MKRLLIGFCEDGATFVAFAANTVAEHVEDGRHDRQLTDWAGNVARTLLFLRHAQYERNPNALFMEDGGMCAQAVLAEALSVIAQHDKERALVKAGFAILFNELAD